MIAGTSLTAAASYILMLAAYRLASHRLLHIPAMLSVIGFDVGMPIYLYTHRDWWHRLIEQQDLFSFLVWMHFGLLIALYTLDGAQLYTARKILRGDADARRLHHTQGKALLLIRGLVIITGAVLANPD